MPHPLQMFAVANRHPLAGEPDAELLGRFVADADHEAFAELVRRYAALVWRACRVTAGNGPAAEDAFQATFLALARRATSIHAASALPAWLQRTAHRAAVRAKRADRPPPVLPDRPPSPDPLDLLTARELLAAVDEEVSRLPERFRAPLVLCGYEGLTQQEAAERLGWSAGSVKGRLERARSALRKRLDARGLSLSALFGLLGSAGGAMTVPLQLIENTRAAARGEQTSLTVMRLAREVSAMGGSFIAKPVAAVLVAVGLVVGVGLAHSEKPAVADAPRTVVAVPVSTHARQPQPEKLIRWSAQLESDPVNPAPTGYRAAAGVWSPDGKYVLTAGHGREDADKPWVGEVRVWDAANGKVVHTFRGEAGSYRHLAGTLAISPDGNMVAAGGMMKAGVGNEGAFVEVWDWGKDKPRLKLEGFPTTVSGVVFVPDAGLVAAVNTTGQLRAWDATTGREKYTAEIGYRRVWGLALHPGGKLLSVASEEGDVWCRAAADGGLITGLSMTKTGFLTVAVHPDGRLVAAGGMGQSPLVLFEFPAELGKNPRPTNLRRDRTAVPDVVGYGEVVYQVAFSPDGRWLAAACSDKTVRLIDVPEKTVAAVAKEHTDFVYTVQFSPDGKALLTVGRDSVKVWSVAELMKRKK